nr:ATP-binding protein [Motilibacter aurantiacus]
MPAEPASAGAARRFLTSTLRDWSTPPEVIEVAALLVSEITGNAVRHGRGQISVTARRRAGLIRVEVNDAGRAPLPAPRRAAPEAESGRGLWLVETLATRWGSDISADSGKDVWFELDAANGSGP